MKTAVAGVLAAALASAGALRPSGFVGKAVTRGPTASAGELTR